LKEKYNDENKQIIKLLIDFILSKKCDDKIKEYFPASIESNDYKFLLKIFLKKLIQNYQMKIKMI
jgi:hypothetical protein